MKIAVFYWVKLSFRISVFEIWDNICFVRKGYISGAVGQKEGYVTNE